MIGKDLGIVIRRRDFRETSIIPVVFMRNYGKVTGMLKGFYTNKKEFTSSMDIFTLNEFIFYPKRSQIWLISYADLIEDFSFLRENYDKNLVATKFLEAIDILLPFWEKNVKIFNLLHISLKSLLRYDLFNVFSVFFIKFLNFYGVKPNLTNCVSCGKMLERLYFFNVFRGGLLCNDCKDNDTKMLREDTASFLLYIQNSNFPEILRIQPSLSAKKEIYTILDTFFSYHLHFKISVDFNLISR